MTFHPREASNNQTGQVFLRWAIQMIQLKYSSNTYMMLDLLSNQPINL